MKNENVFLKLNDQYMKCMPNTKSYNAKEIPGYGRKYQEVPGEETAHTLCWTPLIILG